MRHIGNILYLSWKELISLWRELLLLLLVLYSFGPGLYIESSGGGDFLSNAHVTFVDDDGSALSRGLRTALFPPYFLEPDVADPETAVRMLDWGETTFVVTIPAGFEADLRAGRRTEVQILIDATKTMQATVGTGYLTRIISDEVTRFLARSDATTPMSIDLVLRRAFNPTGDNVWLSAISGLLDHLTMLTIVLTGAALIREREHGTLEHLMVLPLNAFEIAIAKVLANSAVVFLAFVFGLYVVVKAALDVPFAGSDGLLLFATLIYLFAAAAIGILLGVVARTMAQFALLIMLVIMPMMILSGGMSPIESQPIWLQPITYMLPSRHYMEMATAIAFRGADLSIVWPKLLAVFVFGSLYLVGSLLFFRRAAAGA